MTATAASSQRYARNFTGLLDELASAGEGEEVSFGELLKTVQRRSFGAVVLLLGFIAISPLTVIPGASWLVAAATLVFSLQMLFGRRHPWMPARLLRLKFSRELMRKTLQSVRKGAHVADSLTGPRLTFLTEMPWVILTSLACIAASLATFPLALVPLGPVLPGLSILLLGIGLTARDGLFLGLALLTLGGSVALLLRLLL